MASAICAEERVYHEIKQGIVSGRWSAGARLVHRKLAAELGVSPVPLVPALRMLERDGLVVNTPGLGAQVRSWTREEIVDLYYMRAFQEALAARLCAERRTPSDLAAINGAASAFADASVAGDTDGHIQADIDFHISIVAGAHSRDLQRNIENLSIMRCCMGPFEVTLGVPRVVEAGRKNAHRPLVAAIRKQDADAAEKLAREHVEKSLEGTLELMGR